MRRRESQRNTTSVPVPAIGVGIGETVVINTEEVARMLRYPSASAVRQAHRRGTLPVQLYRIGKRRRLLALLKEVDKALSERLEPSGNSPQDATTNEEVDDDQA